jgi:DNA ligase-1
VRRQDRSDHWKEISFVVFDAPAVDAPFEDRIAFCRARIEERRPPYAVYHPHERCTGVDHLRAELRRVEALGGEGLMLRRPGSRYEVGRSASLLKVKSFFDAEARVVEHLPGAGRHKGRLGALLVELADGTRFSVGTGFSDRERREPPPVGAVITFRYQELSEAGVPRFPSYVCVRDDVRWPPDNALVRRASASPPTDTITSGEAPPAPAPPAAPPKPSGATASGAARRFELSEGGSSKFWEIEVDGARHTVRYGRLGTAGQAKTKDFADAALALRDAEKLIAEKTAKGYRET